MRVGQEVRLHVDEGPISGELVHRNVWQFKYDSLESTHGDNESKALTVIPATNPNNPVVLGKVTCTSSRLAEITAYKRKLRAWFQCRPR